MKKNAKTGYATFYVNSPRFISKQFTHAGRWFNYRSISEFKEKQTTRSPETLIEIVGFNG